MIRVISLSSLVHEASTALQEYARWPDTEARKIAAERAVEELRVALHGYDRVVPRSIMLTLVADMLDIMFVRDAPVRGIRVAFDKMIDIFDPAKDKDKRKPRAESPTAGAAGTA
jgi:hypothetical protein